MLNQEEIEMVSLVVDYFDHWQTIATRKEIYDQIKAERLFSPGRMLSIFPVLTFMVISKQLTWNPKGYYSKNW